MGFLVDAACLPLCRTVVWARLWEPEARSAATTERGSSEGWVRILGLVLLSTGCTAERRRIGVVVKTLSCVFRYPGCT